MAGDPIVSRRGALAAMAAGATALLAGCEVPFVSVDPPPLREAWLDVREGGDAAFAFRFDGDVQSALDGAPFGERDVLSVAAEKEIDMSFGPVSIPGVDVPASRLVQGRIEGFADALAWPVGTWFSTPRVTYERALPEEASAPLHVRFPEGGYTLPDAAERASRYRDGGPALFDYDGAVVERTFPFVQHYSYAPLAGARATAEYRFRVVADLYRLYDVDWYRERGMDAIREGFGEVVGELGKAGVESIVTSPLPSTVTAPLDVKGVHDAAGAAFPKLRAALDTLEQGLNAAVNESWMYDLRGEDDDVRGLGHLGTLAGEEWAYRNPAVATTNDTDRFATQLDRYRSFVADQRTITRRLLSSESVFQRLRPSGGDYWQQLYDLAQWLLRSFDRQLRATGDAIAELRTALL